MLVEVIRDEDTGTVRIVLDSVAVNGDRYRVADLVWSAVCNELRRAGVPGVER